MAMIKFGVGVIKEIGKFFKKDGAIKRAAIIKDGYYVCSECETKLTQVGVPIPNKCPKCNIVLN